MPGHPLATASTIPWAPSTPSTTTVSFRGPSNWAWTVRGPVTVTWQYGWAPAQAPDQPTKTESGAGLAYSWTGVPRG